MSDVSQQPAISLHHSLMVRGMLMLTLLVLLVLGGAGYVYIRHQATLMYANTEAHLETTLKVAGQSLGLAVWNFDDQAARDTLKALTSLESFCGARIVDKEGQVFVAYRWNALARTTYLIQAGKKVAGREYGAFPKVDADIEHYDISFIDPHADGAEATIIGKLEMCDDHRGLIEEIKQQALVLVGGILALVLVLGVVASLALRVVFDPLSELGRAMGGLQLGLRKITSPSLLAPHEVGRLGNQFNQMIDGLAVAQQELKDKIEALSVAKDQAEQANQAKSQFLSNMSHELRTPMHAILNYSEMGAKQLAQGNSERLEKYLDNIQTAGKRLLSLINGLLDLSKLEAGKMTMVLAAIPTNAVVDYVLMEMDSLFRKKALQVRVDHRAHAPTVMMDKERMIQVLVNLLSNAINYSPEGGAITITTVDDQHQQCPALKLSVGNRGACIPEADLDRIFHVFEQSADARKVGGTGLGLSICREIVQAHGGVIWAENGAGSGVTFHILIPVQQPKEPV